MKLGYCVLLKYWLKQRDVRNESKKAEVSLERRSMHFFTGAGVGGREQSNYEEVCARYWPPRIAPSFGVDEFVLGRYGGGVQWRLASEGEEIEDGSSK